MICGVDAPKALGDSLFGPRRLPAPDPPPRLTGRRRQREEILSMKSRPYGLPLTTLIISRSTAMYASRNSSDGMARAIARSRCAPTTARS